MMVATCCRVDFIMSRVEPMTEPALQSLLVACKSSFLSTTMVRVTRSFGEFDG